MHSATVSCKFAKMRILLIISTLAIISLNINGQTRTIHGQIVDEDLQYIPMVSICNIDTVEIAKANIEGQFKFDLPVGTKKLLLLFVGMEWTTIELKDGCDTIDVIMMNEWIYDFISLKSADRKRLKRFKKLPELHKLAYEKGIFSTLKPCYNQKFEAYSTRKKKNK
jgi:hypothetical protein